MNHNMKLNPDPFTAIETGKKNIELRLNDEKRQQINVGDTITFANTADPEQKLFTKVTALHYAPSFAKLFTTIPLSVCGFDGVLSPEEAADAMRQYYSEEAEIKYGALGIELVLIAQRVTLMSDPTYVRDFTQSRVMAFTPSELLARI